MPRSVSSLLSVALSGLLALAAATGELWLVVAGVVLVQLLVAAAPAAVGLGTVRPTVFAPVVAGSVMATALAFDPGLLAGTSGTRAGRDALLSSGVLTGVLAGSAVVVAMAWFVQMLRRDGREHLVRSVAATVCLGVLATLASGWVAAARASQSTDVVLMAAVGLSVAVLVWAAPGDRVVLASVAVVAGAAAGAVVPLVAGGAGTWVLGVAVGAGAGLCALLGQVMGRAWSGPATPGPEAWAFPAALSVALVGPVAHLGAQLAVLVI